MTKTSEWVGATVVGLLVLTSSVARAQLISPDQVTNISWSNDTGTHASSIGLDSSMFNNPFGEALSLGSASGLTVNFNIKPGANGTEWVFIDWIGTSLGGSNLPALLASPGIPWAVSLDRIFFNQDVRMVSSLSQFQNLSDADMIGQPGTESSPFGFGGQVFDQTPDANAGLYWWGATGLNIKWLGGVGAGAFSAFLDPFDTLDSWHVDPNNAYSFIQALQFAPMGNPMGDPSGDPPVPEARTWVMMLVGFLSIGLLHVRVRKRATRKIARRHRRGIHDQKAATLSRDIGHSHLEVG